MVRLEDSVVVITGAASGMGQAMAEAFGAEGANIVIVDIDENGAEAVAQSLTTDPDSKAITIIGDITEHDTIDRAVERATGEFGTIDVLCNNAGLLDGFKSVGETSEELWDQIMGVHLKSTFLLTKRALPVLQEGPDEGVVVNTASVAGKRAGSGGVAYTASKHGVVGFTKQLAHDYGPDIRANAVCPGLVKTGMNDEFIEKYPERVEEMVADTPAGRHAMPEEVADLAVFLASNEASFIHGSAVNVDGGSLAN